MLDMQVELLPMRFDCVSEKASSTEARSQMRATYVFVRHLIVFCFCDQQLDSSV